VERNKSITAPPAKGHLQLLGVEENNNMNQVIDLLKNHRSIRKFKQESISNEKVLAIIEAAGIAATSNFIQAYSVIRVTNKKNRKQIVLFSTLN
jgi:nitroreductase